MKRTKVQRRRARNTTRRRARKRVRGGMHDRFSNKTGGPITHKNQYGEILNASGVPIKEGTIYISPETRKGSSYDNASKHTTTGIPIKT